MQVPVIDNIPNLHDEFASLNRVRLQQLGLFTIAILGGPGCGKTTLIESTLQRLSALRIGVIAGDLATQRDANRIARFTNDVVQINTGKGCHLEAHHVVHALDKLNLERLDLLFIENLGNLIVPPGFDLGQNTKVSLFCTTAGDDKAAKHPHLVCESNLLLLNKIDLLPHVPFNLTLFRQDIERLNPEVELLEISPITGNGLDLWIQWITQHRRKSTPRPASTFNTSSRKVRV